MRAEITPKTHKPALHIVNSFERFTGNIPIEYMNKPRDKPTNA